MFNLISNKFSIITKPQKKFLIANHSKIGRKMMMP
nr:MAG TPA: hypothetical protein [Bacteriophage sp.]